MCFAVLRFIPIFSILAFHIRRELLRVEMGRFCAFWWMYFYMLKFVKRKGKLRKLKLITTTNSFFSSCSEHRRNYRRDDERYNRRTPSRSPISRSRNRDFDSALSRRKSHTRHRSRGDSYHSHSSRRRRERRHERSKRHHQHSLSSNYDKVGDVLCLPFFFCE